jgi:transglutaminase-like putative cysteine protease
MIRTALSLFYIFAFSFKCMALETNINEYADATVSEDITVEIKNKACNYLIKYSITLFNADKKELADFYRTYDKHTTVKFISGKIYDVSGKEIKSIKKNDLTDVASQSQFASDARIVYYELPANTIKFPFTVEYIYEVKQDFLLYIEPWFPVPDYGISVKSANYTVLCDKETDVRYFEKNNAPAVIQKTDKGQYVFSWSLKDFKAVKEYELMPPIEEVLPHVLIAPAFISFDNNDNTFKNWQDFGKWIHQLNKDKNKLPDELKTKLFEITKDKKTIEEKAKTVYEFVQNTTRYVSVQFGIGGFQPIAAEKVYKTGYGDCKALVNYTVALLNSIDIPAYYTLVLAGNHKNIIKEFPSNQFNHVILCLPLEQDTVWLECTSQKIAFGFLGDFTDDRDVLVISDNSFITHTKKYSQQDNQESSFSTIQILQNGDAVCSISERKIGLQSEYLSHIYNDLSLNDRNMKISGYLDFKNIEIDSFKLDIIKNTIPEASLQAHLKSREYATATSSRLFIPVNPAPKYEVVVLQDSLRNYPFYLYRAYSSEDTTDFTFPSDYKIETKESSAQIKSEFGTYKYTLQIIDNKLRYIRSVKIEKGKFEANQYKDLHKFIKEVSLKDGLKIMLKKTQ